MAFKQSFSSEPVPVQPAAPSYDSILPARSIFRGDFETDGSVRIDGTVEGNVRSACGDILIGESARVTGNVEGESVTISGVVKGDLIASGKISLLSGGNVCGDVSARALIVESGAAYSGKVKIGEQGAEIKEAPKESFPDL